MNASDKWLFLMSWLLLGWMRVALLCVSFKRLSAALEHHREIPVALRLGPEQVHQAIRIGRMVARASRFTPWQSSCLAQVLVVQRLLARQHIPGQFYLGVSRYHQLEENPVLPAAHAWLQCDRHIVNGAKGHDRFAIVSTFSWGAAA